VSAQGSRDTAPDPHPHACRREFGYFAGDPDEIVWSSLCDKTGHELEGCQWHLVGSAVRPVLDSEEE
jgi:hypothetical protein